jgi:hypothetical protein
VRKLKSKIEGSIDIKSMLVGQTVEVIKFVLGRFIPPIENTSASAVCRLQKPVLRFSGSPLKNFDPEHWGQCN